MSMISQTSAPEKPSRPVSQWMQKHAIFSFFVLAYAISWILTIPVILAEWQVLPKNYFTFHFFFTIKSFGPFAAAYIMTRLIEGPEGWSGMKKRIKMWNLGWKWYVMLLLGVPAMMLLGISLLPGALASFQGFPPYFAMNFLVSFVLIFFAGGPMGEEPGWRGFALPRMQARWGALRGTLLLGLLWTFWHLPDFLTTAQKGGPGAGLYPFYAGLPIFLLEVMALAVLFTWVTNRTRGSLFAALLLHTSYNAFSVVLPLFAAPSVTSTDLPFAIVTTAAAVLILAATRGRLGHRPDSPQG